MPKKTSKNNDLLNSVRDTTSPKVYDLLLKLVNNGDDDLANMVLKIDYLIEYASNCVKARDYLNGREALEGAKCRIKTLKEKNVDTDYLEYLFEGINKKCK
ncbi:hypothetical protein [Clostridium senegalense]|uniref:Uncharacterized protein n=1 Tax=Clostridium senegalense TaxID=1465809 RepID=A0A6M0H3W9_9CLOT|nr:hypothetical protein [Clostridium senegalense]NEU04561.1 hypothetical protein [Clostridium senegalense]